MNFKWMEDLLIYLKYGLAASFFETRLNRENQPLWVKGFRLLPNGQTYYYAILAPGIPKLPRTMDTQ